MSRSSALKVQTPGAPPEAGTTQPAQEQDSDEDQTRDLTAGADDVDALKRKLTALEAKNAELQADLASKAKSSIIYEPETPHGKLRLAASDTGTMTVAAVSAAIKNGKLAEPITNYLCADGHYCRRG
jgi:hypothetical protein